jgi:hypothetical protein
MACRIDGNTMKLGIVSFLDDELSNTGYFSRIGDIYVVPTEQHFAAQEFTQGLNRKFKTEVIRKISDTKYKISIPEELLKDYVISSKEGQEMYTLVGLYNDFQIDPSSWNEGEMFTALNYPEITEMTNDVLKSFLKSLNPDFRVEEIDNLSVEGVTHVKDFLIQVRTLSKFSAMPEEVAHVFIELLPDNNPLKKDMLANITSFPIYSQTLNQYKETYQTTTGIDYDKIKREAAAKLVAEYITAKSSNDTSRVEALTKVKQNFIQRWIANLVKWLGLSMLDKTRSYADIAGIILSGENDQTLKTAKEIEDISYTNSYFFRLSEEQLYDNTYRLLDKKPPRLLEIISNFSKEFGRKFNDILKEEKYAELNAELKRSGTDIGKINRLTEIKALLGEVDLKAALDSESFALGVKQFLEAVDRLDILSESILTVVNNKQKAVSFDEAIKNIKELEGYFSIYETFNNIISADLADALVKSGVAADVIQSIVRTQSNFENVNRYILSKIRDDLFVFYKSMLSDTNTVVAQTLQDDLDRENAKDKPNPEVIKKIQDRIKKLIITDENITKMLSGKGRDIDNFSTLNHLLNASIINGDLYLAGITKFIQNKLNAAHTKSSITVRNLYEKIDPLQKGLAESAEVTGKNISFVDKVFDRDSGEERSVLTWLNPHKDIQPVLDGHRRTVQEAQQKFYETDEKDTVAKKDAADDLKAKRKAYSSFLEKYYNRPFVKEYYDFRQKYDENPTFLDAMNEYRKLSEMVTNSEDFLKVEPENDELWAELAVMKRERTNLLNEYNLSGELKQGTELERVKILKQYFEESAKFKEEDEVQTERTYQIYRNRYEQKVDFALQEIRVGKAKNIAEVEKKLQEMLKNRRLRITTIYNMGAPETGELDYGLIKDIVMEKWYAKNITIQRNEEFKKDEAEIRKELDELQKKGELSQADIDLKEAYDELYRLLFGSRDEIGEINPDSLSEEDKEKVIELEDRIAELKQNRPSLGVDVADMTPEDKAKFEELGAIMVDPAAPSGRKRAAIRGRNAIVKKYKNVGKNKKMKELINLLGSLTEKIPTQYYWDRMSTLINDMAEFTKIAVSLDIPESDKKSVIAFARDFTETIDNQDWDNLDFTVMQKDLFEDFLEWLRDERPKQYEWFVGNHSEKVIFDHENGYYTKIPYARSVIYQYSQPVLDYHQKIVFNKRYRKTRVKDEYRTGYDPTTKKVNLKVGVHITNRESSNGFPEFLPLLPEQGEPTDSPYRNEQFYNLRSATDTQNQLRFQYLEVLKGIHLAHQEMLPPRLRTWMAVPVMSLSSIEEWQNPKLAAKEKWKEVKGIFTGDEIDQALAQESGIDTAREIDQYTQTTIKDRIPKLGMSQKLSVDLVSRDLLKSTAQFIIRAHEFDARSEASPVTKALIRVMNDNAFKNNMSNKERAKKFESIYSQMILQEVPDAILNNTHMRRVAKFLTGNTALRMLADPIGGVINYGSAMINDVIEASAGKYLNLAELAKGKVLAFQVNVDLMSDYNKKANLSYYTLLFDTFDFIQGEFEEDLLDRSSSKDKHASVRQLLMIPRKSGELMAQTAVAMGMLERTKVKNTLDNKDYPVHQIYKKSGNNLVLREGFPQEWNPVDGPKFMRMKELINRVNLELHGNYAKINQSEASRYAIGKLAENMKRWFMPAFQRRFGRETSDIVYQDINEGYYRTSARAARNVFGSLFSMDFGGAKDWMTTFLNTPRYRENLQRMGAEIAQAAILFVVFALLLGYSGDDKNKSLDNNSWIHNTAILISMRVYSETTAYIPFPPFGFQEMKRNVLTPFSLPADAISNFAAIAQLGLYQVAYWMGADSLEGDLYYQKNSGFWFSEKGDSKLFKYMLKAAGLSGYTGIIPPGEEGPVLSSKDVAQYIKTFDNLQKRLK